jgi:hypothetical protein
VNIGDRISSTIEQVGPDPALIDLTKRIIEQNGEIVRMNAALLARLMAPVWLVKPAERGEDS